MAPESRMVTPGENIRTFPGMYTSHYTEAFDAFAEVKSSPKTLDKGSLRKGYKPGSSLRDYPPKMVNGMTADEALKQYPLATSSRQPDMQGTPLMPVWDRVNCRWDVGESHKFDFHTVTFGSQLKMDHPGAPTAPKLFSRTSQKIGEAAAPKLDLTASVPSRSATLTVLGDWSTTVYDRPSSSPSPSPAPKSPGSRPMTSEVGRTSKLQQARERGFLTKSLPNTGRANMVPRTWGGIDIRNMVEEDANPNRRTRFNRGADRVGTDVMRGSEVFDRYATTNRQTEKIIQDILADQGKQRSPKPGQPYHPVHIKSDRTQVCGQAPGWFGVPAVTVAKNDKKSEGTLKRWNAVDDPPFWMVDGANERAQLAAKVKAAQTSKKSSATQTQSRPSTQQSTAASVASRGSSVRSTSSTTVAAIQAARAREKASQAPFRVVKHTAKPSARDMATGPDHVKQMQSQRYQPRRQAW
mmetsp:Transcript_35545/g.63429  ORF Transcript_35545/g.63429 Transcript_35545/m.63429 type:complete len:467 (-) Transcript_35545:237-1637(-)